MTKTSSSIKSLFIVLYFEPILINNGMELRTGWDGAILADQTPPPIENKCSNVGNYTTVGR